MVRLGTQIWLPLLMTLVPLACGGGSDDGGLRGEITVRTTNTTAPTGGMPSQLARSFIFLGDGRFFVAEADENGDATFRDQRIRNRVDVTTITQSVTGEVRALTVLNVTTPEFVLGEEIPMESGAGVQLSGTVSGFDAGNTVTVRVISGQASGSATALGDGTYVIDVLGQAGTTADIYVEERDGSANFVRAGMARDVLLEGAAVTQNLSLADSATASVTTTLSRQENYGGGLTVAGTIQFRQQQELLTSLDCTHDVGVVTCPSLEPTGSFADILRTVEVRVGSATEFPNGEGSVTVVVPNTETTATIEYPDPGAITAPPLGTMATPSVVALDGIEFSWEVSNLPSYVMLNITKQSPAANDFTSWTVIAPPSRDRFEPIILPEATVNTLQLSVGTYTVDYAWNQDRESADIADAFRALPISAEPGAARWSTRLQGVAEFQ